MAIAASIDQELANALRRRPDAVWIRDGLAMFGWGRQLVLDPGTGPQRYDEALRFAREAGQMAFASFTFDEEAEGSVVLLPELAIRIDRNGRSNLTSSSEVALPDSFDLDPMPLGTLDNPGVEAWRGGFNTAMEAISRGAADKVVLSRSVEATFETDLPVHSVIEHLLSSQPLSQTYMVEGLIGSSPELLVELDRSQVRSVSLAGSADRNTPGSVESLDTPKMTNEHLLAADSVEKALAAHCRDLDRRAMSVATYGDIHHLATSFEGHANPNVTVMDLLRSLHPTAAVAGTPTENAVKLIRHLETHSRGRYAGPVGWFDASGDGEFAIALRCGQVSANTIKLFAGAGLVAGSTADSEFDETEIKLQPMLQALGLD